MKSKLLVVLGLLCSALGAVAQTSTITYQGQISSSGSAADGLFDLRFALSDDAVVGNPVGNALTNATVVVSNGLFTTTLDFGSGAFDGSPRWLEIGVRTNGSTNAYTILTPRQLLTATPYAIRAANFNGPIAAANLMGIVSDTNLSANVALLSANANFVSTVTASNFVGNAAGLVNLPATNLTGSIVEARLPMSIISYGALGGTNDATAAIQAALNSGTEVWLQPTNYSILATLYVSNNSRLLGRGATLVFHSTAFGEMINTTTATNWLITGLTLVGNDAATIPLTQGMRTGIRAATDAGGTIRDLKFFGFNAYGLNLFGNVGYELTYQTNRSHFQQLEIAYCFKGVMTEAANTNSTAEYVNLTGLAIWSCNYGAHIASGNIFFTDSLVTGCNYGVYVAGGYNQAHGVVDGLSLNHNDIPIWCNGFNNSFAFQNCTIFASKSGETPEIRLLNCQGVTVQGCLMGDVNVTCNGAGTSYTNGGNFVINNTFQNNLTFAVSNGGRVEEYGNRKMIGNADPLSAGRNVGLWRAYDPTAGGYVDYGNWGFGYMGLWLGQPLTSGANNVTLLGGMGGGQSGNTYLNSTNEMLLTQRMVPWAYLRSDRGLILGDVQANQTSPGANNVRVNGSLTVTGDLTGNIPYVRLQDEKTSGTDGGTSTANTWTTRTLNTKYDDSINTVLTETNTFILPPGTYRIYATAPVVESGAARTRLFNVTSNAVTLSGTSDYTPPGAGQRIPVAGLFTITGTNLFRIEQNVQQATAAFGYGRAGGFGTEIYTQVELFKQR